jgi:hypothetical protein
MRLSAVSISKSLGVARQTVDKAIKKGRIDPNKPIEQIRIDWERNADPLQRARGLSPVPDPPAPAQPIRQPATVARRVADEDSDGGGPAKLGGLTKFDLEMRDMAVRLKMRQAALREKEGALSQSSTGPATVCITA